MDTKINFNARSQINQPSKAKHHYQALLERI
jgi:hypothetical protein